MTLLHKPPYHQTIPHTNTYIHTHTDSHTYKHCSKRQCLPGDPNRQWCCDTHPPGPPSTRPNNRLHTHTSVNRCHHSARRTALTVAAACFRTVKRTAVAPLLRRWFSSTRPAAHTVVLRTHCARRQRAIATDCASFTVLKLNAALLFVAISFTWHCAIDYTHCITSITIIHTTHIRTKRKTST